ncbi:MAG: 50S ribosomal protein L30 [Clostridia bacterium]|nr:50S ribosomal protein L30 [Clostridia bacterium]
MATKKTSTLNIKLVKSTIGCKKDQIATVKALGLNKIGEIVAQPKNDATMGKIKKVIHLVEVTEA